jgi:hypothetical protein
VSTAVVMAGVERVIAAPLVSVDSTGSRERITDTRVDMAFIQPGNCHQTDELWTTVVYRFVGAGTVGCCWDGEKTQISVVNQVPPPTLRHKSIVILIVIISPLFVLTHTSVGFI